MVNRFRTPIALTLLIVGLVGIALAANLTLRRAASPFKPAAVTVPIIKDPGTGAEASAPSVPAVSRTKSLEGARVRIGDLGIDLPIVEGDGENVPLFKAAHYPNMLWPGQGGRSLLYAHARPGMFGPLFTARVGQKVDIKLSDGRTLSYTIKEYFPHWPNSDLSILQPTNHEQLVLLTCTSWNASDPKIIAIAEPSQ